LVVEGRVQKKTCCGLGKSCILFTLKIVINNLENTRVGNFIQEIADEGK